MTKKSTLTAQPRARTATQPQKTAKGASSAPQAKAAPTAKPAARPAPLVKTVDRASKLAPQVPAMPVTPVAVKAEKKPNKPRPVLVRDSFTMPQADFALIAKLKATALGGRRAAKKSELLRAGLQLLAGLDAKALVLALDKLEAVKTGRPKKAAHK